MYLYILIFSLFDYVVSSSSIILKIIRQNVPLVKEELLIKKWKGINVHQEVVLKSNIFFIEKKGLKISAQN